MLHRIANAPISVALAWANGIIGDGFASKLMPARASGSAMPNPPNTPQNTHASGPASKRQSKRL